MNFIRPCSVAICSASGTDSSHLERTHSLSHLRTTANQQQASRKGRSFQPPAYLQRISAFRQALRSYTSCIFFTWVRGRGAWRDRQVGHVTKGGGPDRLYLLQEQRQELHQLVGGEGLHVGLAEGAQVLLLRLRGVERVRTVLQL